MFNVCFLVNSFEGKGGIGRVTSTIINSLATESDIRILTVSYIKESNSGYALDKRITRDYIFKNKTSMSKALLSWKAQSKLKRILKQEKVDLLIACGVMYYPLALLSTLGTKTKCIYVEHTNPENDDDFKFEKVIRLISSRLSRQIVVISQAAEDWYKKKGNSQERVKLIYNAIPCNVYSKTEYDYSSQKILSVGRITYQKNFEGLIDVAKLFIEKYPNWTWDIFGDGRDREKISALIQEKKLENKVILRGLSNNLLDEYKKYAFIVMTSRYEGFPMSLIEAAANKLPMISYDIQTGPNEIVKDGVNGYLIDFENKVLMAQRIESLINNSDLRVAMSNKSYETSQMFNVKDISNKWLKLMFDICKEQDN